MKKHYETPESTVVRVELESPICGGSVDITAQTPTDITQTQDQVVNSSFQTDNSFTNGSWDATTNN